MKFSDYKIDNTRSDEFQLFSHQAPPSEDFSYF